jgi:hypothetical protein
VPAPRRLSTPLARAALVLVLGFGVLSVLWFTGRHPAGLPGLPHFPSAIWGDGLLLPAQALALGRLTRRLPPPARRWPVRLATLAGAGAGAAVVAAALLDPAPPLDWTLPRPHHLNAAGSWHAAFIVVTSALFARWWLDLVLRLRRARHRSDRVRQVLAPPWPALAFGAGLGYTVLAVHDGWGRAGTTADVAYLVALGLAAVALVAALGLALGQVLAACLPAAVRGTGAAATAGAVLLLPLPQPVQLVSGPMPAAAYLIRTSAVAVALAVVLLGPPVLPGPRTRGTGQQRGTDQQRGTGQAGGPA